MNDVDDEDDETDDDELDDEDSAHGWRHLTHRADRRQ